MAALVLEDGGDEDEAISGLLHDTAEDQGGQACLDDIRSRFGERVAAIVAACSDTLEDPKPQWRERKERYLEHLQAAAPDVLRVSLADKLYNARAILGDYRRHGEALWARFNAGPADQLWYYASLARAYRSWAPGPMADELARVVTELGATVVNAEP